MQPELIPADEAELQAIKAELNDLGFAQTIRDPLYELFVKAWTDREDPAWTQAVQLTPEQREARARLAAEIVEELRRERQDR
jgi:hypothetical protein